MKRLLCTLLVLLAVSCRSRSEATPTKPSAAPPVATTASVARSAPPAPELVLPTSEDFEESASQEINEKNFEQELDKLERELEKP
jgi:hypothetical protein